MEFLYIISEFVFVFIFGTFLGQMSNDSGTNCMGIMVLWSFFDPIVQNGTNKFIFRKVWDYGWRSAAKPSGGNEQ